ncbi:hypothetical protein AB4156_36020 [Cupriavidus sp. 2MCAB6]
MRGLSRYTVAAGDKDAVLNVIVKAKVRCRLATSVPIYSCYEAGRDGFWLPRWLTEQGIHNLVVDSSSMAIFAYPEN